jgi:hypothetical protein
MPALPALRVQHAKGLSSTAEYLTCRAVQDGSAPCMCSNRGGTRRAAQGGDSRSKEVKN